MATNDSTTGGFMLPVDIEPQNDTALDDAIHSTVVGLTGLSNELVRPRWQPNPPNQPMHTTDWAAFGVISAEPDAFAYEGHSSSMSGNVDTSTSVVERDELLYVLCSFYGPNAARNDARLRAGLQIVQNRFALAAIHVGVVEYQKPTRIPSLMKESWVPRVDATLVLRRRSVHTYQVRSVESPNGMLDNEDYLTPILYKPDQPRP